MSDEQLGPTGQYPDGKLGEEDEGELRMAIASDPDGTVHINFGKPIAWFAMPPAMAIDFARAILKHAGVQRVEIGL